MADTGVTNVSIVMDLINVVITCVIITISQVVISNVCVTNVSVTSVAVTIVAVTNVVVANEGINALVSDAVPTKFVVVIELTRRHNLRRFTKVC